MRYEAEHKERTHKRIVRNAARKFRAKGLNGPAVSEVMKASGLTVGGFYKHFRSKEDLLVAAIEEGLRDSREKFLPVARAAGKGEGWKEIVKRFLSVEHCDHPEGGCPMAAMSTEIARATPAVKNRVGALLREHRDHILPFMPGDTDEEKDQKLIIAVTAMNGALAVARTMTDPKRKQQVLDAVRDHLLNTL
jgi:TetR/AcrR family transcriptional regulator, transcriptional repressor for nem operon